MTLGRIVGLLVLVVVLYAIITAPAASAGMVKSGGGALAAAGSGLIVFLDNVVHPGAGTTGSSSTLGVTPTGGVATGDGSFAR